MRKCKWCGAVSAGSRCYCGGPTFEMTAGQAEAERARRQAGFPRPPPPSTKN